MKTHNYVLDLMAPMQANKEVLLNEAFLKLDAFVSSVVIETIDNEPEKPIVGEKYLISQGDKKDHICYCVHISRGWEYLAPSHGMFIFLLHGQNFLVFLEGAWQGLYSKINDLKPQFDGVKEKFFIKNNAKNLYLYLENDCYIDCAQIDQPEITIILKQNYAKIFGIKWDERILWQDKNPPVLSKPNCMALLKFYMLPESNHLLGQIISTNYQF